MQKTQGRSEHQEPCAVCGDLTKEYTAYGDWGMEIKIWLCGPHRPVDIFAQAAQAARKVAREAGKDAETRGIYFKPLDGEK